MSRLSARIEDLRNQISDLEGKLESAEDKLRRQNIKRNRKAFRKKMISDPFYLLMNRLEHSMFSPQLVLVPGDMLGISTSLGREL